MIFVYLAIYIGVMLLLSVFAERAQRTAAVRAWLLYRQRKLHKSFSGRVIFAAASFRLSEQRQEGNEFSALSENSVASMRFADAHAAAGGGQLVEVNVADFGFVAVDQAKGGVFGGVEFGDEPRP